MGPLAERESLIQKAIMLRDTQRVTEPREAGAAMI